jgi:hypothetical protein
MDFLPLDDSDTALANIDVSSAGNKSIFANGRPLDIGTLKRIVSRKHFNATYIENNNMYLIPFTESLQNSLKGVMRGFYPFTNENFTLDITPGAAAASEVQTITGAAGASAGFYQFEFMGQLSQPVAFNATVAALKAAFEAIPSVINYPGGIAVTFSGTLASGAAITCTFSDSRTYPLLKVTTNSTAAGAVQYTTTRTTKGNGGWTTASTYDVIIHALYHREVNISGGKLGVRNLI